MDKIVSIVFGGVGGIGRACIENLLSKGIKVLCCDISASDETVELWREKYSNSQISYFRCDITQASEVKDAFKACISHFGHAPSWIINAAAIIDEIRWESCIDINLIGSIRIVKTTVEEIGLHRGGRGGSLLLLSSILGLDSGANVPVYTASKHGIVGFVRSFADPLHYKENGVRINCICPTGVDTPLLTQSLEKMYKPEGMEIIFRKLKEQGNLLSSFDVADEVLRLLEDENACGKVVVLSKADGRQIAQFQEYPKF